MAGPYDSDRPSRQTLPGIQSAGCRQEGRKQCLNYQKSKQWCVDCVRF